MKLILLSGGSGKRLWPLSNDSRSKQFLKVLSNDENELESMVQRVWRQLGKLNLTEPAVIATSKSQVEMIYTQLGENVPTIIEPTRRDTFPAIALAASYLYSKECIDIEEVVGILPVDPYVEDSFFSRLLDLEEALQTSNADLALMGITPTFPSEKYGYIVPFGEESSKNVIKVSHFKEKPQVDEAEQLLSQGALWNAGVFAFKLGKIISLIEEQGLPVTYDELSSQYDKLPKISFDYAVVEKTENIIALAYDGRWKDLGTWNTLTEEMGTNVSGKAYVSEDSLDTHVINELDIPVSVLGLSNIIVAASPDGILISDREASPRVKELVGELEQIPMYEERYWGRYWILDYTEYPEGNTVITKRIEIDAERHLSYHYHNKRSETWTILKGNGIFVLNGEFKMVLAEDILRINPGDYHAIKALTNIDMIEIQSGSELIERDVHRMYITWEEVERNCRF